MVFPKNIKNKLSKRKQTSDQTIVIAFWSCLFAILILNFFFIVPYLSAFIPPIPLKIITYSIIFFIAQYIFRVFVIHEDEKMEEFLSRGSDTFTKYMGIRNIDTLEKISVKGRDVTVFPCIDGTYSVFLCLNFGKSDRQTAIRTQEVFKEGFKLLASCSMGFSDFTFRSKFEETAEGRNMLSVVDNIEDKRFKPFVTDIYKYCIDIASLNSNVPEYILVITTRTHFQRMELESIVNRFVSTLLSKRTSIRTLHFLDSDQVLNFTKRFYKLDAIDVSRSLVTDYLTSDEGISGPVGLYQIFKDGKLITYPDLIEIKYQSKSIGGTQQ